MQVCCCSDGFEIKKVQHGSDLINNKCVCVEKNKKNEINDEEQCFRQDLISVVILSEKLEFTSIIEMLKKHSFFETSSFIISTSDYALNLLT